MNPAQTLPLRDIHLPGAVSWWPPAIGWWITLALVILMLWLSFWLFRRLTRPVVKKSAKAQWATLLDEYRQSADKQAFMQQLSVLLRRIGISYLPRSETAGITGKAWYRRLNELVNKPALYEQSIELLSSAPYRVQADIPDQQIEHLINDVQHWIDALAREARHD